MFTTAARGAMPFALALSAAAAHANHIDLFTDAPFSIDIDESVVVSGDPSTILGGQRRANLNFAEATAAVGPGETVLEFDSNGATAPTLTLEYGAFDGGAPLNADFASAWDGVIVNFAEVIGGGMISLELESGAGSGSQVEQFFSGPGSVVFDFDDAAYAGVDFSDIDRLTFDITLTPGASVEIDTITRRVIPAPASFAAFIVGGVAAVRRRAR